MGEVLRVRVFLVGSSPEVWRLIEIDAGLTLDRVHTALQVVMGWEDAHLHDFVDADPDSNVRWQDGEPAPRRWGPAFLSEDDDDLLPEEDTPLGAVLTVDRPLFYEYDFGDRWLHRLEVIEVRSPAVAGQRVTVIRGAGRCPLEDSGGIGGYEHLLTVLADPGDEEYDHYAEWVTGMTGEPAVLFNPALYNPDAANRALREQFPTTRP